MGEGGIVLDLLDWVGCAAFCQVGEGKDVRGCLVDEIALDVGECLTQGRFVYAGRFTGKKSKFAAACEELRRAAFVAFDMGFLMAED